VTPFSVVAATVMFALATGVTAQPLHAQEVPEETDQSSGEAPRGEEEGVDGLRLAIVGATLGGTMVAVHFYQQNGWWKDNQTSFHFREDLNYGLSVDKIGHFYAASGMTFVFSKALTWANLREPDALLIGAGSSILFQSYIEIRDGFSTWGFDRVDFAANVAGALYPLAQYHLPVLQSFQLKASYHPSDLLSNPGGIGFRGQQHIIFDDYEGQTFWLSVRVNRLLPEAADPFWPDWLALSVGYGARRVAEPDAHSIILIGLDYDMTEIIPQSSSFLRTLSEALNFIRFPAPAVQISPNAIWYGLYF